MEQQLYEFPVLMEDNEVLTLFLNKDDMEKASQDLEFVQSLVAKEKPNNKINNTESEMEAEMEDATNENAVAKNNIEKSTFSWPDKAVLLLIEMYREKEEDFSNSFKRNNKIWAEIAAEMNKVNPTYKITAQQCTSKMSGLKRTYKNIIDMNKKSGNNRNSWAFFSVMDSLFGDKASIKPPAIATSDGPSNPNENELPLSENSFSISKSLPKKRKRIEKIMEEFVDNIATEKEERKEDIRRREENKEKIREEKRIESERRHNEQMDIQKSLVSILQQFFNKM